MMLGEFGREVDAGPAEPKRSQIELL